ncbi:ABC transporter substrate-binding protein [Antribacter gilvus]|uniref:ABC transporter substrate-binding protein n=1 Tax=Antribacter gilvus TaxID=2304675 RepID=UPI000F79C78D|nr:extracellular solute-binding protein [Antribacter gilvus]
MRIARRTIGGVGVAAVAALALAACSGGTATDGGGDAAVEPVPTDRDITLSLAWWGNDDRAAKYEEAVDLFEEKYPNITVQTQFQAFPDYWTARNTEAAGGALPDVIQMDLSYLRQYANNGQLLDLTEQVGTNLNTDGYDESLLSAGAIEGAQFGIPTSTNTLALFYNGDVLDGLGVEPPAEGYTWEDYAEWAAEVHEAGKGKDPAIYGTGDYTGTFWFFLQNLIQQGKEPFTADGQLGFDEADLKEWLESGSELREAGAFFPTERAVQLAPLGGFTVNESASEISWDNFLAGYVADSGTDNIQMLPVPAGPDGSKQFWKPSMLLSASANTKEAAASAALIDFLVNEPEVGRIFGTSKGVPAVAAQRDAMDVEAGSIDERVLAYEESVAELVTEPAPLPVEGFGAIEGEYLRLSEELGYGNITVDEFAEQWFANAAETIPQP